MIKRLLFGLVLSSVMFPQLMAQAPMKTLPSGLKLQKLKTIPGARKMKFNEFLTFHFKMSTPDGKVLGNTFTKKEPVENLPVKPPKYKGDINEVFGMLAEGDSVIVKSPVDTVAKYTKSQLPSFAKPGTYITYHIKVVKIRNQTEMLAFQKQKTAAKLSKEKVIIDKYIAEQQFKNVKVTGSGLHYVIHQPGNGPKPRTGQTVKVNYAGKLTNGKLFDTSIEEVAKTHGKFNPNRPYQPYAFQLGRGRVIKGWDEGIALLSPGAKATLIIPSYLGYGARGAGGDIPPNAVLVFEVELVGVKQSFDPQKQKLQDQIKLAQYLASNKITNAKTTPSGLRYVIHKQGTGAQAQAGKTVRVNYTGKLLNGNLFDTSIEAVAKKYGKFNPNRPYKPIEFKLGVGRVIRGWDEGIALLKVGAKATIYIPSHLGYGSRGAGNDIPPNSVLMFEVELLEVK